MGTLDKYFQSGGGTSLAAGDIITTLRNETEDGRSLLPCDGSALVPGVYPKLEPLLQDTFKTSQPFIPASYGTYMGSEVRISNDGSLILGATLTQGSLRLAATNATGGGRGSRTDSVDYYMKFDASDDGSTAFCVFREPGNPRILRGYYYYGSGWQITNVDSGNTTSYDYATCVSGDGSAIYVLGRSHTDADNLCVYRSTNGSSWTTIYNSSAGIGIGAPDASCSRDGSLIMLANPNGRSVHFSSDGGVSWSRRTLSLIPRAVKVAATTPNAIVYEKGSSIYVTTNDGGATWIEHVPPTDGVMSKTTVHGAYYQGDRLWLMLQGSVQGSDPNRYRFAYSDDHGVTWILCPVFDDLQTPNGSFALSADNSTLVYGTAVSPSYDKAVISVGTMAKHLPLIPNSKIVAE